jgi:hypothetical protein
MAEATLNYQTIRTSHAAREAVKYLFIQYEKFLIIFFHSG